MTKQQNGTNLQNKEGEHIMNARENMTNRAISELKRLELISESDEAAARTLYRSCLQAYQRTRDNSKPWYKEVEFCFSSPLDMVIQYITKLQLEWQKWKAQQLIFDDKTVQGDRPSLDRIDSNGHYSIDNIRTDSIKGNYTDASNRRRKKTALIEIENGQIAFRVYDSQTVIKTKLNIPHSKLKMMKKQPYELGVLKEDRAIMKTGKQIIAMEYIEKPARPKEEQKKIDKQRYEDLEERIRLLEYISYDEKEVDSIKKLKENLELYKKFGWDKL